MGRSSELREWALRFRALATSGSEVELRAAMKEIASELAARAVKEEIEEMSVDPASSVRVAKARSCLRGYWRALYGRILTHLLTAAPR